LVVTDPFAAACLGTVNMALSEKIRGGMAKLDGWLLFLKDCHDYDPWLDNDLRLLSHELHDSIPAHMFS